MSFVTGKWEFEVATGKRGVATAWVSEMLSCYQREVGEMVLLEGSAAANGFAFDDSVKGWFQPQSRRIVIFYAEENDLASRAEELAHYFQYQQQGLLGKTEQEIGAVKIDANEREIRDIMLAHVFRVRR